MMRVKPGWSKPKQWSALVLPLCLTASFSSCDDYSGGDPTTVTRSHLLRLQGSGQGSGTVTAPDATPELACTISSGALSGACAGGYQNNVTVRLIATPNAGSTFTGWSGIGCAGTDQCVVEMSQERTITAAFATTPR